MSATAQGASLPCALNWSQSGRTNNVVAATAPPIAPVTPPPARREASRKASTRANSAPVRATTIHSATGIASSTREKGANRTVKTTGSGFHEEPPVVSRLPCAISRPQTSQANGS